MEILGLHYTIWLVLAVYFAGMLLMGWWSKRDVQNQEGYLLGNRQFGQRALYYCRCGGNDNIPGQHHKDVSIMLKYAENLEQELPLSMVHLEVLEKAIAAGDGELDNSAVIREIRRRGKA